MIMFQQMWYDTQIVILYQTQTSYAKSKKRVSMIDVNWPYQANSR